MSVIAINQQNMKNINLHLYDEPSNFVCKPSGNHLLEKFHHPFHRNDHVIANGTLNHVTRRKHSKLRQTKSMSALNSNTIRPTSTSLDENEIYQVERFYYSHKSFVFVSRCMANLYFTKTDLINEGRLSSPRSDDWQLEKTGVPVIIFDKGETKNRNKRQLQICLAERGTGFTLWRDIIDNLTDYKAIHPCFHTLYLSCDHRKMAGLSFDSAEAAQEFLQNIESITSDPVNIALSAPKRGAGHKKESKSLIKKEKSLSKLPKKCEISAPCLFQHVTNVDIKDFDRLYTVSSLVRNLHTVNNDLRSLNSSNNAFVSSPSPVASTSSNSSMITSSSENSSNLSI